MSAMFRRHALRLLKGLIKRGSRGINHAPSRLCEAGASKRRNEIHENANSNFPTYINGIMSWCFMLTLIENTDVMQNIYNTVARICFMTYL